MKNTDPNYEELKELFVRHIEEDSKEIWHCAGYKEYLAEPLQGYITTMVEKYITTIKPLCEKIRNMNYGYYAVEADIEAGATAGAAVVAAAGADDNNGDDKAKKAITYTLVALPYRLDQIEQEQK